MRAWVVMTVLVGLVGCAGAPGGRWVGPVTPAGGAACGPATRGVLVARGGDAVFTPSEGVLILRGPVGKDGSVQASASVENADHRSVVTRFDGRIGDGGVSGTMTSPACSYSVALKPG